MHEPCFPAVSTRVHCSVIFTDGFREDIFLKGAVYYFFQQPAALCRRFILTVWNSLFCIAIT